MCIQSLRLIAYFLWFCVTEKYGLVNYTVLPNFYEIRVALLVLYISNIWCANVVISKCQSSVSKNACHISFGNAYDYVVVPTTAEGRQ